jgi:hypothetical protein
MALITSAASGNFSAGATWTGGVVPTVGDEARASTGHTITIDVNTTCNEISNAGTGKFVLLDGVTLAANVTHKAVNNVSLLEFNAATPAQCYIVGLVSGSTQNVIANTIANLSTGTINITGNIQGTTTNQSTTAVNNTSTGIIMVSGNVTGSLSVAIRNSSTGTIIVTGNIESGTNNGHGIFNASSGLIQIVGSVVASNSLPAISSTNAAVRVSGSFIYASNGQVPVNSSRLLLWSIPSNAQTRYALDGVNTYVDMFTADNNLGQANPADVRSGVSYASGNLIGRLTVPARGSVALSVNYGPSMPFTATRSGTTATATLSYSYPFVAGDQITVTGAFNSEWNGTYTIASIVSGTEITFTVPATHSASTGTGAAMQTTGTAVLDPSAVASAVWGAAARTITGGTVDTATTLTNAPTVPSASQIATQVRTELGTELGRIDATVSSRLASASYSAAPTASANATAVRTELTTELALIDAPVSSASAPTASTVATAVRSELTTELAHLDADISTRATPADIPASDITAIKTTTDALNTDRLAQVSTVATTGSQLAAALS